MTIEAKIIKDSISIKDQIRVTTFILKYPRFIHAEFMTHRDFSRNASSSRAIPVKRQIELVLEDPAVPIAFTKNQRGMQGGEILSQKASQSATHHWLAAMQYAVDSATMLEKLEVHKQYANRILEPFSLISVVVTATRWSNFFALRHHSAAQPEIRELARQMWEIYSSSTPETILMGEWHLPFVSKEEKLEYFATLGNGVVGSSNKKHWLPLIKRSVARCARVSYLNHDGTNPSIEQDEKLYERLLGSAPIHASPAEHQATPASSKRVKSGNFHGWIQFRKTLKNECVTEFKGPIDA